MDNDQNEPTKYKDRCVLCLPAETISHFSSAGRARSYTEKDGELHCEHDDLRSVVVLFGGLQLMLPDHAVMEFDSQSGEWQIFTPIPDQE